MKRGGKAIRKTKTRQESDVDGLKRGLQLLTEAVLANPAGAATLTANTLLLLARLQIEQGVDIWPFRILGVDSETNELVVALELPFKVAPSAKKPEVSTDGVNPLAY